MKRIVVWGAVVGVFALLAAPCVAAGSLGDEFDGAKPDAKWQWHNEPKAWDVGKTKAKWLTIQADTNRNLWAADDTSRLYQEVLNEPFDVETHMATKFAANSVVAGIVAMSKTDNNWVTIKFWGHANGTAQLQYQNRTVEAGNGLTGAAPGFATAGGIGDFYLRMTKDKDVYTAFWKMNAADDWTVVGPTTFPMTHPLQLSLFAGVDAAAGEMTASFEYFKDNITPLAVHPTAKLAVVWANAKIGRMSANTADIAMP